MDMDCNCTDDNQQKNMLSLGDRLRHARESIGLSQNDVAECLCLKLSIIKNIEKGYCMHALKISSIFFYGYIRSYARLVGFDNIEIAFMESQLSEKPASVVGNKKYNFINIYRQYNMQVKCLIMCVIFFMFFATFILIMFHLKCFFLKNEYFGVVDLKSMRSVIYNECEYNRTIFTWWLKEDLLDKSCDLYFRKNLNFFNYIQGSIINSLFNHSDDVYMLPYTIKIYNPINNIINYINNISNSIINMNNHILSLSFTSDCWVEVIDSTEKILYVGTKYSGDVLNLNGKIPYRLVVGSPESISILYQGNIVNLDCFIHPHQVTRLTIPVH